jgi:hypothetical protein
MAVHATTSRSGISSNKARAWRTAPRAHRDLMKVVAYFCDMGFSVLGMGFLCGLAASGSLNLLLL